MARSNRAPAELEPLDEIARLLSVLIRNQYETQTEFIVALSRAGISNPRIATFLNTSTDSVGATLRQRRK